MAHQPQSDARSLYHRWRSRSFSEVVAQEHVTRTLKNAVSAGRIVHAYLFCGPRGTGKTSTARILAKAVNCLDPQQGEPCNRCSSCVSVNEGRAIDLIEIDAASNRGIDDARDLREKIKYSPAEARYKVYIIDEAHMLTSEASNALLKTLEEPPEHAILILATTESHKILPTISSRCQRFDFRRIPMQAIVEQLSMIGSREGLRLEAGVLDRVARLARGSLRDAESLLDQLVAYCGEEIDLSSAREVLGLTGEEAIPEFAEALRCNDLARGFQLIDALTSMGADLRHFARELVEYLRVLMVVKSGADTSLLRDYRSEELPRLQSAAEGWRNQQLLACLRAFGDLEGRMRVEAFNQLQLEIAFMEVTVASGGGDAAERSSSQAAPAALEPPSPAVPSPAKGSTSPAEPRPAKAASVEAAASIVPPSKVPDGVETAPAAGSAPEEPGLPPGPPIPLELAAVKAQWDRIRREVGAPAMSPVYIALDRGFPIEVGKDSITLGFEGDGMRYTLERQGVAARIGEALGKVLGTRIGVRFRYGVKISNVKAPSGRDAVVEAAVRELGFKVLRIEETSE